LAKPLNEPGLVLVFFDGLVRSRDSMECVIPAKAGIKLFQYAWTPAFAGVTAREIFYEAIIFEDPWFINPANHYEGQDAGDVQAGLMRHGGTLSDLPGAVKRHAT
jgi:hypothetical protein